MSRRRRYPCERRAPFPSTTKMVPPHQRGSTRQVLFSSEPTGKLVSAAPAFPFPIATLAERVSDRERKGRGEQPAAQLVFALRQDMEAERGFCLTRSLKRSSTRDAILAHSVGGTFCSRDWAPAGNVRWEHMPTSNRLSVSSMYGHRIHHSTCKFFSPDGKNLQTLQVFVTL